MFTNNQVAGQESDMGFKTDKGWESAERRALHSLWDSNCSAIQSPDFIYKNPEGIWETEEVKTRNLYQPGADFNHWATGMDKSQLRLRQTLLDEKNIRTKLVVYGQGVNYGETYTAYLDDLEAGPHFDLPRGIRLWPMTSFKKE